MWFDSKGNLISRAVDYIKKRSHAKSEEGIDFKDSMKFIFLSIGGQSTAGRVWFESETTERKYSMFLDDFDIAIRANAFINNHLEGTFKFVKRGQSQAIALILEQEPPEVRLDLW
jgi:hypothetical protein